MSEEDEVGNDIFITQNSFSCASFDENDINDDFEQLLNKNVSNITFEINCSACQSVGNSSSDEELLVESQKLEEETEQLNSQSDNDLVVASQKIDTELIMN